MSGDPMKKVASGDPVKLAASWYNTVTDAAADWQRRQTNQPAGPRALRVPEGLILCQNISGADVDRNAVLGIEEPLVLPSENLVEFQNRPAISASTPALASQKGLFVITAAPIAADAIGPAFVFGVCPVKVHINSSGDGFADVKDGDVTQLDSNATDGAAQILWAAPGTGTQWCLVRLGKGGGATSNLAVKWGYLTANWTPGTNTVNVQPCVALDNATATSDPAVTVYLRLPVSEPALYCGAANGDVIAYLEAGSFNLAMENPLPKPSDPYNVWINMGTALAPNFQADFLRASA